MEPNTVYVYRLDVLGKHHGVRQGKAIGQNARGSGMMNHARAGHSQAVTAFAVVGVLTLGF